MFAEINADRVYWEAKEDISLDDYKLTKISLEKWAIGRYLYTKAVGRHAGMDIKGEYKHPEGNTCGLFGEKGTGEGKGGFDVICTQR